MELVYGIVNKYGELLDTSTDEEEALDRAHYLARGKMVMQLTSDSEGDYRTNPPPQGPAHSFKQLMIPEVDLDEVMRRYPGAQGLRDAYFEKVEGVSIHDIMPKHTALHRSASDFASAILASNEKLKKKNQEAIFKEYGLLLDEEITGPSGEGPDTWGLSLAPAKRAWQYVNPPPWIAKTPNLCTHASKECEKACLIGTGQNVIGAHDWEFLYFGADPAPGKKPRPAGEKRGGYRKLKGDEVYQFGLKIKYTSALYRNPEGFIRLLVESIARKERNMAKAGKTLYVRLNVLADVPWELFCPGLFRRFRTLQFYDYTKVPDRLIERGSPENYHLSFSFSGANKDLCLQELNRGRFVTVVFVPPKGVGREKLPIRLDEDFWGLPVLSGDLYDARPLDHLVLQSVRRHGLSSFGGPRRRVSARNAIISLRYKLPRALIQGGTWKAKDLGTFVIDTFIDPETGLYLAAETANQTQVTAPQVGVGRR